MGTGRLIDLRLPRLLVGPGLALVAACGGEDGRTTLLETHAEPAGANCQYGGLRVDRGFDDSGDGLLSGAEILSTSFVCNQRVDGRSTATRLVSIAAGPTCAAGGYRIEVGIDDDDDGVLDDVEVDQGADLCEGVDGEDGYTTRVRLVAIASGIQGSGCPHGGTRIDSGADTDRDGVLDDSEVESFQSVCAVQVASSLFLTKSVLELPGANCAQGGTKMTFGFDDDADGVLDEPAELDGTPVYVCNQQQLVSGKTGLVVQSPATGAQCTYGGYVYTSGLDDDYDGILDPAEIDATGVVCNGIDGLTALVESTPLAASACSGAGGYRIRSGLDDDGDGVLDAGEVTVDQNLCNGAWYQGVDGRDSLLAQGYIANTPYCDGYGGSWIAHGLDLDADLYLDNSEIEYTTYICDPPAGYDGANALVMTYDDGGYCSPSYGLRIDTGTDYNYNGVLDGNEYTTDYLCY